MKITVEEALSIYPLSKAKLVAGAGGVNRLIQSVNTMDAPDVIDWISSGELLLTTAFAIKDTPDAFLRLLKKLDERGAAGIGIKLGRYWSEIPQIVLEEADRLNFPVLDLPFEFAFSDQMNALFQAEFVKSTQQLHNDLEKQKQLVRLALQKEEFANLFPKIGDILAHSIVVVSARGQLMYNSCDWPEVELLKGWPWNVQFYKGRTEHGWFCRIPLLKGTDCYGFLLVIPASGAIIPEEEGLFHQAAEILCYHMDHYYDDQQTVAGYQWGVVMERYLQEQITKETFLEQSRSLGSPLAGGSHVCVLTVLEHREGTPPPAPKKLRELLREVNYHPRLSSLESHHLIIEDTLLHVFKVMDPPAGDSSFNEILYKSYLEILGSMPSVQVRSYISRIKPELGAIRDAYEECAEARRISSQLSFESPVVFFADLEFSYLFSHIPKNVMDKYCHSLLQPLMIKDADYATDMLRTLEAYITSEGQINEVAKQLFIHRNTVQYRLEKLSEILDLDLRLTGDLLKVKLMFMFRQLMAQETHEPRS
ncbi:PucR family transcriptional regulator [Paenibacillus daejeonensis]|uniref:PucR family transcriptional regulator n=1 Tax=Paenibacillus daejeonensis TaxID=135193 RepID=UPI00037FA3D8|nr:PucR family transcriptional regulator [Paenibacillus daejeonensis]